MTTEKETIVLTGTEDWDLWIEVIKSYSLGYRIWEMINPEIALDEDGNEISIPELTEPTPPLCLDKQIYLIIIKN